MMKLRSSPPSPFGRKIKLAMAILELQDKIEIENADTTDPSDSLRSQNPLGKIPVLVLQNGDVLYDSAVILEYLDTLAGENQLFPKGNRRFEVLRLQTLADGMMDAAILRVYEKRFKDPKFRDPAWDSYQAAKIERCLDYLEEHTPQTITSQSEIDAGTLTLACALGYLDMRFGEDWRTKHSNLSTWVDAFETALPAFTKTKQPHTPVPENGAVDLR